MDELTYFYDKLTDTAIINGVRFSGEFFRYMASAIIGQRFEVVAVDNSSGNKVINIRNISDKNNG